MIHIRRFEMGFCVRLLAMTLLLMATTSGCSSIQYIGQAAHGHAKIMFTSKPVESVLENPDVPQAVREKLRLALKIREFAVEELGLPDNGSYLRYADLERDYVMWNVFATPELSLDSQNWCYPIIGCLSYRGFYSRDSALELAATLRSQGVDVYVAPVAAYSTVGWFADPLISPMMRWPTHELARVIFHELAHQQTYIPDDTELNESYATALAEIALLEWAKRYQEHAPVESTQLRISRDTSFVELLLRARDKLERIYKSTSTDEVKRKGKADILEELQKAYMQWRMDWNNYSGFDKWMTPPVNNAKLASIATYHALVPVLLQRTSKAHSNLARIVELNALVDRLSEMSYEQRRDCLSHAISCRKP